MKLKSFKTPNFRGWKAVVLHRPHQDVDRLTRQLERFGMKVTYAWPQLSAEHQNADIVLFDADMGHEEQFPWPLSDLPMPMVALIGSEAPGRVEWAIQRGAGAHLGKPIGSTGVFGALVVAVRSFQTHWESANRIADLEIRLSRRPNVVEAVLFLMDIHKCGSVEAYGHLRSLSMAGRVSIEDAADELIARAAGHDPEWKRGRE
ncbi:ANTAR domain-containing protein [Roseibium polysiphoniae]|uniref:ANTAR domain-containing response regulator n=1 Tax=Roseibium polysiphoniae TaxID=2571221 RepID=UPI003296D6AA